MQASEKSLRAPVFNVPPVVTLMIALVIGSYIGVGILPRSLQLWVGEFGGVSPRLLFGGMQEDGGVLLAVFPLISHIFLHADLSHLLLNCVWLLAFGAPVAIRLGAQRALFDVSSLIFILFFILSGVFGALVFAALNPSLDTQLIGASGGVSGLLGAVIRTIFVRQVDLANVRQTFARLSDSRVITASIVILATNLLVGLFGAVLTSSGNDIAWEAHMGGYLFGLLAFPAFAAFTRQ
ncbi:MAG: rhomboid family intramembrane serine protease [Parvularculaceae bacterium]